MIERFIQNDLTLKRWRRYKQIRRAVVATWAVVILLFLSVTAEMWANSKPIVMSYQGKLYFPVYVTYHPTLFGQDQGFVTDYRQLRAQNKMDWSLWPPVEWDPFESNDTVKTYPAPPSSDNIFGTDDRGRDIASRLLYGFRYSFSFAIIVWLGAYILGIFFGAFMGFMGGKTDLFGQRVVEVFESMPILLLLITLVSIFGSSLTLLSTFAVILGWMMISYYVRAEFLKLRKREFVEAAEAMGASRFSIIFKHILPNSLSPVVTFSPFTISSNIYYLAALDYLGFGLPPPTPSWGELLQQAEKYFSIAWWLAVFPSIALFISLVVLNLIGEGVREAFDPRK